jgi:four helix bundle protein
MTDGAEPRVVELANAYLVWCERWKQRLRRWPGMNDHIQRSAASIVANLGEGFESDTLVDKRRYFRYALTEVGESRKLVASAARIGALPDTPTHESLRLLRDIKWDLIRLIRWTQR